MAFLDPLRRAIGVATPEEIEEARRNRARIEASEQPRDRFAAAIADHVKDMGQGAAGRTLNALGEGDWPNDPDMRWNRASTAALKVADETVERPVPNMDRQLGEATGRRALTETAMIVAEPGTTGSADRLLKASHDAVREDVLSFMSYGKAAEHNAGEQARDMALVPGAADRLRRDVAEFLPPSADPDWTLKATRTRLAMAQSGLLDPDRTVEAAVDASQMGSPTQGALAPYDRSRAASADAPARLAMLEAMQDRTMTAAHGPDWRAAIAPAKQIEQAPTMAAALGMTEVQQKAHAAMLMAEKLMTSRPSPHPRAVLTGGQPGSGKSYIVRSVGVQFEDVGGAVVIDPDEIRPTLPYMAQRIAAGDLEVPNEANVDAGTIAYKMIQIAKLEKRNVIVDGTLQNTGRAEDLAGELRAARYQVDFHGMAINPDLSHARTYSRREEQIAESPTGFGRGVSDEFHDQAVKGYGLTIETFQKKASVDSMTLHFGGGSPIQTRFVDGRWTPAIDMKATLDEAHQRPSPEVRTEATRTWTVATEAMKQRGAPVGEIVKVDGFRTAAAARETPAKTDDGKAARLQAMHVRSQGQGR